MCVAIAAYTRFPTRDELLACEKANPHGGGVAWVEKGMVRWVKGLDAKVMASLIADKKVTLPAMIHFRIATSGGVRDELCHPFPVSHNASTERTGRAKMALVHNGHWSDWGSKVLCTVVREGRKVRGHWSDSRALAWLAARYGEAVFELAMGQKICTLDEKGQLSMYGDWTGSKEEGIWYSNMSWKWKSSTYGSAWTDDRWKDDRYPWRDWSSDMERNRERFYKGWKQEGNGVWVRTTNEQEKPETEKIVDTPIVASHESTRS